MDLLREVAYARRRLVLLSTHDLDLALRYADTIWLLDAAGSLHVGAPEDVALSGRLGAAFSAEGFEFDLCRGELRRRGPASARKTVTVTGTGQAAIWVRRAVERLGYAVDGGSDAAIASIEVGPGVYSLRSPDSVRDFRTIGELASQLGAAVA